jgi:nitrogen regulatory protein P-II 1
MSIKKVTAIFDELLLDNVEQALKSHGVTGFTIHPVKGRGYYANMYSNDGLVNHSQIEIYTNDRFAQKIAELIMLTVNTGADGQGLVAITSVDALFGINQQNVINEDEFNYFESTV